MGVTKYNPFEQLIIDHDDDINGVEDSWRQIQASPDTIDPVTISSNYIRTGTSSLRIYLVEGELYNSNHRSEVRSVHNLGQERWFSFSVLFPSGFTWDAEDQQEIIQQIHAGNGSPPIAIQLRADDLYLKLHDSNNNGIGGNGTLLVEGLERETWYDIVGHFNIDEGGPNGFCRVWINRELKADYSGDLNYDSEQGAPYFKLGCYKWKWNNQPNDSITTERELYYGYHRWADGTDEATEFELLNPEGDKALSGINYTTPDTPTLASPIDSSTGLETNPDLMWNSSQDADDYQIQVSTDSGFTTTVFNQSNLTGTTQVISDLSYDTEYFWRVRAENSEGFSNWSNIWSFTTLEEIISSELYKIRIRINLV